MREAIIDRNRPSQERNCLNLNFEEGDCCLRLAVVGRNEEGLRIFIGFQLIRSFEGTRGGGGGG